MNLAKLMPRQFVLPKLMSRTRVIENIATFLLALPSDSGFVLEVREQKSRRTHQQNAYLWGVCYAEIMKHLPDWDDEDVHTYMLGEWGGWETVEGFGKKRVRPIRRSSKLTIVEFGEYVDFVHRRAAEHGIVIPDADPEWFAKEHAA